MVGAQVVARSHAQAVQQPFRSSLVSGQSASFVSKPAGDPAIGAITTIGRKLLDVAWLAPPPPPDPPDNVHVVEDAQGFMAALQSGAVHIELRSHISLAGGVWPAYEDRTGGFLDVDNAMVYLPNHLISIRGNCKTPFPGNQDMGLQASDVLLPQAGNQCLLVLGETDLTPVRSSPPFLWAFGKQCRVYERRPNGVWLDQLYVKLRRPALVAAFRVGRNTWLTNVTMHGIDDESQVDGSRRVSAIHADFDSALMVEDSTFTGWNATSSGVVHTPSAAFFNRTTFHANTAPAVSALLTLDPFQAHAVLNECSFTGNDAQHAAALRALFPACDPSRWVHTPAAKPTAYPAAAAAPPPSPVLGSSLQSSEDYFLDYESFAAIAPVPYDPYARDVAPGWAADHYHHSFYGGAPAPQPYDDDFTYYSPTSIDDYPPGYGPPGATAGYEYDQPSSVVYSDKPLVVAHVCGTPMQTAAVEDANLAFLLKEQEWLLVQQDRFDNGPRIPAAPSTLSKPLDDYLHRFGCKPGRPPRPWHRPLVPPSPSQAGVITSDQFEAPDEQHENKGANWLFAFFGLLGLAVVPFCIVLHRRVAPGAARRRRNRRRTAGGGSAGDGYAAEAAESAEGEQPPAADAPPRRRLVVEAPTEMYRVEMHLWRTSPRPSNGESLLPEAAPKPPCPHPTSTAAQGAHSGPASGSRGLQGGASQSHDDGAAPLYVPPACTSADAEDDSSSSSRRKNHHSRHFADAHVAVGDSGPAPASEDSGTRIQTTTMETTGISNQACVICFENTGDHVMVPCGHGGYCRGCAQRVFHSRSGHCPMCRAEVGAVVKVSLDTPLGDRAGVASTALLATSAEVE